MKASILFKILIGELKKYLVLAKNRINTINIKKAVTHLNNFSFIWILFSLLFLTSLFAWLNLWVISKVIGIILLICIVSLLVTIPMNAVYGLMGTNSSIKWFFGMFIIISFLFAIIYQIGFFSNAGITYDVNQPHLDYTFYKRYKKPKTSSVFTTLYIVERDTTISYNANHFQLEKKEFQVTLSTTSIRYQKIGFWNTFRNTIMTTLMQEPTDFFAVATTYNASMDELEVVTGITEVCIDTPKNSIDTNNADINRHKASLFHWILIFQVLISWIFFGVFISLLYSKFRYES